MLLIWSYSLSCSDSITPLIDFSYCICHIFEVIVNHKSFRNTLLYSRIRYECWMIGIILCLDKNKIIKVPPNVINQDERRTNFMASGSGTALVLKGLKTRSHCVRIACLAPAHCPGPVRRYWYGVQGPKKTFVQSTGSLRNRRRRLILTPTYDENLS